MAIKDPNVLNRINTLNTNLEKADIAKVEENIWKMLFNVLEWTNSISVDSELYASINDVTNASDIATRISNITFDPVINVNWIDIRSTEPSALSHGTATETQASIDAIKNSETDLTALESNIANLKLRFEENIRKLTDIADEQHIVAGVARGLPIIDSELSWQNEVKPRIDRIIKILTNIIIEASKVWGGNAWVLAGYKAQFMTAEKTWIPAALHSIGDVDAAHLGDIMTLQTNYTNLMDTTNKNINKLTHEKNLRNHINWLNKTPIHIPNWFLPFWDAETVASEWGNEWLTRWHIATFNNRIAQLNNLQVQISDIRARYTAHKKNLENIQQLQKLQERLNSNHPSEMRLRQNELRAISDISYNNLWLWAYRWGPMRPAYQPNLPNTTATIWATAPTVVPLNFVRAPLVWARSFDYTLCDSDGTPLKINWWKFEYKLWAKTVTLQWINFVNNDLTNQVMTINDLQVSPIEWLTFPLALDLNVRVRIHDNATWLDIDHHKPIHLEITRPTLVRANREAAYDSLVPPMDERIAAEYSDKYREGLETDAIWSILREWWNEAEVNEIYNNETRRNMFIDRVRTALAWSIPLLTLADLQTWFRGDMTREDRDVPVQYLLWETQFQNYIRQSIPNNLKDYASKTIRNNANNQRDAILQEFLNFQTDIANSRVDNNDNLRALAQVPNDMQWPEWHPNNFIQRLTWRESAQNNYTKFFQWRHAELKDLSLETEDGTIKYWVKVEVTWVNKIVATIDIDWKEEPEIIEAPSHDRLIRWILTRANTKDGEPLNKKLRCNMALAVLKAMVLMSPQRLNRQIPATNFVDNRWNIVSCDRVEAFIKWWNLKIRWWHIDGSRTRQNVTIFDEAQFKELHDVDMLEDWIHELSTQVNMIMNATAQEYHEATSAMLRNDGNRYIMRYNTAQRLRWWPIKRLWWRMVHGKTSNDFNFDTAVNEAWKAVNIKLDKWLFTVSWDFDGQHYEHKGRNLWSILRKRINRKRVFDGVELAMVAAVNELFIQKLRENHRVQTENFIVADVNNGKTWRTYVFDDAWNLSYLEMEDINLNPLWPGQSGRVDPDQVPAERIRCNEQERREFMQNPLLAWRLQREMRRRLALF